jgi:hypothetical protein
MAAPGCVQLLPEAEFFMLAELAAELVAAVTLRVNLAVLVVAEAVAKGLTMPVLVQPQALPTLEAVEAVEVNCLQMVQQAVQALSSSVTQQQHLLLWQPQETHKSATLVATRFTLGLLTEL